MLFIACGIDESGTAPGDGSTGPDVGLDGPGPGDAGGDKVTKDVVSEPPPSCTTLDITACASGGVPSGWAAVVTTSNVSCPNNADYTPSSYVDNLGTTGSCTCGCTPTGAYTCVGDVEYGQNCGSSCNSYTACSNLGAFDAGDTTECVNIPNNSDFGIGGPPGLGTGTANCNASTTTSPTATSNPLTVCAPKCTADYCGVATGYSRCIWSATQTACPAPFTAAAPETVGLAGDINVGSCGCTCAVSPSGACNASVDLYQQPGCDGGSSTKSMNTCAVTGATKYQSLKYNPTVPSVMCNASAGPPPTAAFGSSAMTVCCLP